MLIAILGGVITGFAALLMYAQTGVSGFYFVGFYAFGMIMHQLAVQNTQNRG